MVVYHIDSSLRLKTGDCIDLMQISEEPRYEILKLLFPAGLSRHGQRYLYDEVYWFNSFLANTINTVSMQPEILDVTPCGELDEAFNFSNSRMCDFNFEMIRRAFFADVPSRYQSLFAIPFLQYIQSWPELTKQAYRVFEINTPSDLKPVDATWLRGGLSIGHNSQFNHFMSFAPGIVLEQGFQYWKGNISDSPKKECLVELPIQIGRLVPCDEYI